MGKGSALHRILPAQRFNPSHRTPGPPPHNPNLGRIGDPDLAFDRGYVRNELDSVVELDPRLHEGPQGIQGPSPGRPGPSPGRP